MSNPNYNFIPWVRYGIGNYISDADNPTDPVIKMRPSISVEIDVTQDTQSIQQKLEVFSPGDIIGINPEAILRTEPKNNSTDFESNYLPFIEFYDEDLPWRYTPVNPNVTTPNRLRPWMALIALKKDEFRWSPESTPLPVINLQKDVLDLDPTETWAWSHVQVNANLDETKPIQDALKQVVDFNPDLAISRIVCPRKLEGNTDYYMFLVPTYELGRKAGLEEDLTTTPLQEPAWVKKNINHDLPYYYHWKFTTSDTSDFETLAKRLQPAQIPADECRYVDIQSMYDELGIASSNIQNAPVNPTAPIKQKSSVSTVSLITQNFTVGAQNTIEGAKTWKMACALMPPTQPTHFFGDNNYTNALLREALRKRINEQLNFITDVQPNQTNINEDPVFNSPPLYGQWLAAREDANAVQNNLSDAGWIEQLNLDPAYRIAAMLGSRVIRENQDKFMLRAWEQVGEINAINEKISNSQLGGQLNDRLFNRNIKNRSTNDVLATTKSLQDKTPLDASNADDTITQKVFQSKLSNAALDPALMRLTSARGRIGKKINKLLPVNESIGDDLLNNIADEDQHSIHFGTSTANAVPIDEEVMINDTSVGIIQSDTNTLFTTGAIQNWSTMVNDQAVVNQAIEAGVPTFSNSDITQSRTSLVEHMNPLDNTNKSIATKIAFNTDLHTTDLPNTNQAKKVMAHPTFKDPVFGYLSEQFPRFIAPGIENMENNTVSLMKVNQAFVESFLLGMNQAFSEELLWREYPTDQRGSYFKNFWESQDYVDWSGISTDLDDISQIDQWDESSSLGTHGVSGIEQEQHGSEGEKVVVMLRGDLFKKFPNLVIYAHKATWKTSGGITHRVLADLGTDPDLVVKSPIFKVDLEKDIASFGFNMGVNEARGGLTSNGNPDPLSDDPGWFFILKERTGELRFGLDTPGGGSIPMASKTADQLDWDDVIGSTSNQQFINLPNSIPIADAIWGADAAQMAYILQQKPSIIAFHASSLI